MLNLDKLSPKNLEKIKKILEIVLEYNEFRNPHELCTSIPYEKFANEGLIKDEVNTIIFKIVNEEKDIMNYFSPEDYLSYYESILFDVPPIERDPKSVHYAENCLHLDINEEKLKELHTNIANLVKTKNSTLEKKDITFNGKTISYGEQKYNPEEPLLCLVNKLWGKYMYVAGDNPQKGNEIGQSILQECHVNDVEKSKSSFNRIAVKKGIPLKLHGNGTGLYLEKTGS
jgi:hypothetical protein